MVGTIVVGAGLMCIIGLIIRSLLKDKKAGKSSCGCDCAHCKGCH